MASISIPLSDEEFRQLRTLAERFRVEPETLLQAQLRDFLANDRAELQGLCQAILTKNADLYRRLAE
jgi:antitoxin FitA